MTAVRELFEETGLALFGGEPFLTMGHSYSAVTWHNTPRSADLGTYRA